MDHTPLVAGVVHFQKSNLEMSMAEVGEMGSSLRVISPGLINLEFRFNSSVSDIVDCRPSIGRREYLRAERDIAQTKSILHRSLHEAQLAVHSENASSQNNNLHRRSHGWWTRMGR